MTQMHLTDEIAGEFAALTLRNVVREYPNKLDHVIAGPEDIRGPRELHPIFYGCFDWHSAVHGFWQLARLYRLFPDLPQRSAIQAQFDLSFTATNVTAEVRYLHRAQSRGFERPYGWAWLLMLCQELKQHLHEDGRRWHQTLQPLAQPIVERFVEFLPKAIYPIRAGTHANTAFAMTLAHAYAVSHDDQTLRSRIESRIGQWYGDDVNCQAWEPSLDDFLSPALMEALCMARILPSAEFGVWLDRFLPRLRDAQPATLFHPATATDRTDGKIAHLDGLNFSRAWCLRGIATKLEDRPLAARLRGAADEHLLASLPHVVGHYAGEHWLATFALLALTEGAQ